MLVNDKKPTKNLPKNLIYLIFLAITVVIILHLANLYKILLINSMFLSICRYIILTGFIFYGIKRKSLTAWIMISMLIGAEIGHDFPSFAVNLQVISKIFLKLIKTIIAPLLFATLVVGIAGHSNLKQVGRMGLKSIIYFEIVSTIALFIGLAAINISQAGVGVQLPANPGESLEQVKPQTFQEIILHIFPENLAKAIYEGQVLQIVVFSIIFGIAVALLKDKHKRPMLLFAESLSEAMFKFTNIVMYFAPLAVGAAIAYSIGHMGLDILVNLFKLLGTLYVALIAFIILVLLPTMLIFRIPIIPFAKAVFEPASIAFATTSSESALPRAMEMMEKFGVPRKIVSFVIPTGYSFNLDGTTLYLSLASIFVAQVAGINLSLEQQLVIVFTLMITSKGVAGVPRASLVILLGTAASFGLPVEPIFIILGIDELMDMARTAVNVIGNCLASAVIAKLEGEFDLEKAINFVPEEAEIVKGTNPVETL